MRILYIPNESRSGADYGWLKTRYSFSFAEYFDPERMGFGALRVINDDEIAPGKGFGTHGHRDMEIVTIPLEGALAHKDSMGTAETVTAGEVQVMSAGTGVEHSEYNASETDAVRLFQIWILPRAQGLAARYDQKAFDPASWQGKFATVVGPDEADGKLMIQQDAWISFLTLQAGESAEYILRTPGNGVYFLVVEGKGDIGGQVCSRRDAVGIEEADKVAVRATETSYILAIEVPMD